MATHTQKATSNGHAHKAAPAAKAHSDARPSGEEIAKRAYEKFLGRQGEHGHDNEDWLAAEQELMTQPAAAEA
jgi:hypothetical protein